MYGSLSRERLDLERLLSLSSANIEAWNGCQRETVSSPVLGSTREHKPWLGGITLTIQIVIPDSAMLRRMFIAGRFQRLRIVLAFTCGRVKQCVNDHRCDMRVGRNSKTDAFTNVNVYNVSTAYNLDTSCPRCISHKHLIVSELTGKELNCITHILPPWSFHNIQLDIIWPYVRLFCCCHACDWLARHLAMEPRHIPLSP